MSVHVARKRPTLRVSLVHASCVIGAHAAEQQQFNSMTVSAAHTHTHTHIKFALKGAQLGFTWCP
jgi:hypothetical protein